MLNNKQKERENTKTVVYIAVCSAKTSPGIYKKVKGFVNGSKKAGFTSRSVIIEPNGIKGVETYIREIISANEHYIVARYLPKIGLAYLVLGLYIKFLGKKLIIDVPTPLVNLVREVSLNNGISPLKKFIFIFLTYAAGPLPFLFAYKIIQYSHESLYFSIFVRRRTIVTGNGVDTEAITCKKTAPIWPSSELRLVAVGNIAIWHGWDKLLEVIKELNEDEFLGFFVHLTIVGEGPELGNLKEIVARYGIEKNVVFTGFLEGQSLDKIYNESHFGVGSLGWHRVGVKVAAPIKSREYLAAGLPFIYSTEDVDFTIYDTYAIYIPSEGGTKAIKDRISALTEMHLPSPNYCRQIAEEKLDYSVKVVGILS